MAVYDPILLENGNTLLAEAGGDILMEDSIPTPLPDVTITNAENEEDALVLHLI